MGSASQWSAIALLLVAMLAAGCDKQPLPTFSDRVGESCIVQFRRDALGAAATNPIPADTDMINGAVLFVSGKLQKATRDWVVLQLGDRVAHIPLHAILSVRFSEKK